MESDKGISNAGLHSKSSTSTIGAQLQQANQLASKVVTQATLKSYSRTFRQYESYIKSIKENPIPPTEDMIRLWIMALYNKEPKICPNTIDTKLFGLVWWLKREGYQMDELIKSIKVSDLMKAIHIERGDHRRRQKIEVSPSTCEELASYIDTKSLEESSVFAAMTTMSTCALRIGDLIFPDPKNKESESGNYVKLGQFIMHKLERTSQGLMPATIKLLHGKTNRRKKERLISVQHPSALQALASYFTIRGPPFSHEFPLFVMNNKTTLYQTQFRQVARELLGRIGIKVDHGIPISYRSGGASELVAAGMDIGTLKIFGGWRSNAVEAYVSHTAVATIATKLLLENKKNKEERKTH
jgi:hypothetical protein